MVKLTADLINNSINHLNTVRERELLLRGYQIPMIENLGATFDMYDAIDLSDNHIRKLDGFPMLPRLSTLYLNNNKICRLDSSIATNITNLKSLYLTNCDVRELADIEVLARMKKLEYLSFMRNPIANKPNYRLYVIHKLPQVRVLDFQRIKQKERLRAKEFFGSQMGMKVIQQVTNRQAKTFVPGAPIDSEFGPDGRSNADREAIKKAIMEAKTLEEVERLSQMLQSGQIPGREEKPEVEKKDHENDVEMEEE